MGSKKPFKTYRQQLSILRDRNMCIPDGSRAIRILKREGYYNIINGYKELFLDSRMSEQTGDDYYKDGVTFEHIYALYDFDRSMRINLIAYLLKVETNLKTKVAYSFSKTFKQNFSYLDINNYDAADPQKVTKLIAKISAVITNNSQPKDQGGQIYHYLDVYKELPLWVLIKKMTFGEMYHFFDALQMPMKREIIAEILSDFEKEYQRGTAVERVSDIVVCVSNMIDLMNLYRNICAHDERLYNTIMKRRGRIPKILLFHHDPLLPCKSRLFDCIMIVGLFVSKKDFKQMTMQVEKTIDLLEKKLPHSLFNAVLIHMGFPKDWKASIQLASSM